MNKLLSLVVLLLLVNPSLASESSTHSSQTTRFESAFAEMAIVPRKLSDEESLLVGRWYQSTRYEDGSNVRIFSSVFDDGTLHLRLIDNAPTGERLEWEEYLSWRIYEKHFLTSLLARKMQNDEDFVLAESDEESVKENRYVYRIDTLNEKLFEYQNLDTKNEFVSNRMSNHEEPNKVLADTAIKIFTDALKFGDSRPSQ